MVMQILVMAVQNASPTATSASPPRARRCSAPSAAPSARRCSGRFSPASLASHLAAALPGAALPGATDPHSIALLPDPLRAAYLEAFTAALHPVFLFAALLAVGAFG